MVEEDSAERLEEARMVEEDRGTFQMVSDAFREDIPSSTENEIGVEEPNLEAKKFFDMLNAAKHPIYPGCKEGYSALSAATRVMQLKTDFNMSEDCVDAWADYINDYMPEDNLHPPSYYAVEKLVSGLGMPYQMIDVCIDNCMIYWREDAHRLVCKFCRKPRFQETSGRVPIPYKRMWYLPLAERLKRLYQSLRTAGSMRWHAEHSTEGEIVHPSDAKAWKQFQEVYPHFAFESRNVYLGLCTDGFNPFGKHGRQYSLSPVIVTPYNLPPSLCMKREFLFLTILVPGPEHPKGSLDVFLQPLIYELQELWEHGVQAFDVSCQQNFLMRAALMWTISDFPAYGMLSGWSTHGRLSCPYCQDNTDAIRLKHGGKTSWFDCHRRFLPSNHEYRESTTKFTKNKTVWDGPPPELDGKYMLDQLSDFDVDRTTDCGGSGHVRVKGCGEFHNWHKKSIFWDLPYWKDQLLRHNLDVMHIEKNFFDNIMNTVLNVKGKTKDNLKSRLDLPAICVRDELHVSEDGKGPSPIFRLEGAAKDEFFQWIIHNVKFPDGYASNLRNCVDSQEGRLSGMKSHDCHVFMERLLPFAFAKLLPVPVHEAIAGICAFFRDLCSRSLTSEGIQHLEDKIAVILCNLEQIFPPSFFDVMEHLAIHLPRETELGGPVQYRWMYPFERFMFHLKKKVKNLSKVEGSIVAQCINEERSNFSSHYFALQVQTKSRKPGRNDDGGEKPKYRTYVPDMFAQVGRLSGKQRKRWLTAQEQTHLHTYILLNCEDILPYERMYDDQVRMSCPYITDDELASLKQREFANWMKFYIAKVNGDRGIDAACRTVSAVHSVRSSSQAELSIVF
ncbi:unnamed protein product [Microthlaspi erraticum]|uniref:DUF4218 domain-containing protein n=1 Tax=Microthlaspi erraticum TaxID=1685480 RepID=A0A6D2KA09_9BRAS|nr:unnamed protein product [Microthlaspi erraticum]